VHHEVDLRQPVDAAVFRQAKRIRSEGVSFNDVSASLQVFQVYPPDQVRLGQIQLVIAAVNEYALGEQEGSHRAVTKYGAFLKSS